MKCIKYPIILSLFLVFPQCKLELPATSSITIDMESASFPVDEGLYGLSLSTDRAGADGIYAELIQNPDFDRGDSLPGWRPLSAGSYLQQSTVRPVGQDSPYSLMVSVYLSNQARRGGVAAEGYRGIPIRQGEQYHLSFFLRTATSVTPVPVRIALEDSLTARRLSNVCEVTPSYGWVRYSHTFTATETAGNAVLSFALDHSSFFQLDRVSLVPARTWKNRPGGFRADLMEPIAALAPAFILYRGEAGEESLRAYRQLCEDLNAEAVYAADSSRVTERCAGRQATLREAAVEACFLIRAESHPLSGERLAYAPVTGYAADEGNPSPALISFTNQASIVSPMYHLLQMFALHRGDAVLRTEIDTYLRPDSLPSIAAGAAWDKDRQTILIKVVNTTSHNEITEINIRGAGFSKQAWMLQMKGQPGARNTFAHPRQVEPVEQTLTLETGRGVIRYPFPPHSITILRLNTK
jgi:hypothetical protein